MKTGQRIVFKGVELVAIPFIARSGDHVCKGCALDGQQECLKHQCEDKILVTVEDAVTYELTGKSL